MTGVIMNGTVDSITAQIMLIINIWMGPWRSSPVANSAYCSWRPSSFSSQHLVDHSYLLLQLQGSCPLLVSLGTTLVCAYPPYRHIYIHIIQNKIKKSMTRQKQGFLFMYMKRDSLLGLTQELCAQWWDRKKAVEKDAFLQPISFPQCSFYCFYGQNDF